MCEKSRILFEIEILEEELGFYRDIGMDADAQPYEQAAKHLRELYGKYEELKNDESDT